MDKKKQKTPCIIEEKASDVRQCIAKSKQSGKQCKNWAMRRRSMCYFHGGKSSGPKTAKGKKKISALHYRHGLRTKEATQRRKEIRKFIKESQSFLENI